ncbi:MAG: PLDc N-terminal domain-containing protein [Candidatus Heimdallarchaeaceae archaeon]
MEPRILMLVVIPLALIDGLMKILATINLIKTKEFRANQNFVLWIILIWFINLFGWVLYFLFGRIPLEKKEYEESWH